MKRLFQINKPDGKTYMVEAGGFSSPMYTETKSKAKEVRNALNKKHPAGGYTVSPGPDHRNYRG